MGRKGAPNTGVSMCGGAGMVMPNLVRRIMDLQRRGRRGSSRNYPALKARTDLDRSGRLFSWWIKLLRGEVTKIYPFQLCRHV